MNTEWETALSDRGGATCELCGGSSDLAAHFVPGGAGQDAEAHILACADCRDRIEAPTLDASHWFCLKQSIWSDVPAVQVQSWRLLQGLPNEPWALELLEQAYLVDSVLAWAKAGATGGSQPDSDASPTLDANGTPLADGDTVTLIKNLDVKGGGFTAKRGTAVKNIRLTDSPEAVEGRINGSVIVLKACFLKKQ
ncbi:MAG TPA: PhnA domain-containing protein [Planctomycetota bacterium]|nr:PhnA domain-containing protein [Planctomycetota bacterium]